jgi:hypothetical protein
MTRMLQLLEHHSWLNVISSKLCQLADQQGRNRPPSPIIFFLIFFGNLTRTNIVGETS